MSLVGFEVRRSLRIAIDAAGARSGGGKTRLRELARTFPTLRPNHEYLFVIRRELEEAVLGIAPNIETLCLPRSFDRPPARLVWEQLRLPGILREWRPDVVFSPFGVLPLRWPEPRPILAMIVSNLAPYSPEILRLYRGTGRLRLEVLRQMTDRSIARADRVFLLSNQGHRLIRRPELGWNAEVIPMAPPPIISVDETTSPPREPYFVVVADILRYKGIESVVSALALLDEAARPLVLVCGNHLEVSYQRRLATMAQSLGVEERLHFLGAIGHAMVLALMKASVGCIVPSRFENKTRVTFEAMAAGAPLILNELETLRDSSGDAALYFDVDRPEDLAAHIRTLLGDEGLRRRLREAGRARVASIKTTDASERILLSLEQLAAARAAREDARSIRKARHVPSSSGGANILVHAVAGRSGAGKTIIHELAWAFPALRPENRYMFVVGPWMQRAVKELSPSIETLGPPAFVSRPPWRLAWEHFALARKRLPHRPDIVFSPFNVLPVRWRPPSPRLAVLVMNLAPFSPELRRMYRGIPRLRLELLRWLTTRSLAAADRVFVVSTQALALIDMPGLESKTRLIPVSPAIGEAAAGDTPQSPSEPYFVVAGDLFRYKGIESVVDAVAALDPPARPSVLICGRPLDRSYARSLARRIRRRGVSDRVRLLGSIDRGQLLALMRDAVAVIAPSRFENKSYVPIEAMSLGTPVISSDIPPARESCGDAALYFALDEPNELSAHMTALMGEPSLRDRMGAAGRKRVESIRPTDASEAIMTALDELVPASRPLARLEERGFGR